MMDSRLRLIESFWFIEYQGETRGIEDMTFTPHTQWFFIKSSYFFNVSQERDTSTIRIIVIFLVIIAVFWYLIVTFLQPKPPEIIYHNETEVETVIDQVVRVKLNQYHQIQLEVEKGYVLNTSIKVLRGGPIDYFILEEDRLEMLIEALEGSNNRFESYERGRGLNITEISSEFIIVNDDNWFLLINNFGHIQDGAVPSSDVTVEVIIEKVGDAETEGVSITS